MDYKRYLDATKEFLEGRANHEQASFNKQAALPVPAAKALAFLKGRARHILHGSEGYRMAKAHPDIPGKKNWAYEDYMQPRFLKYKENYPEIDMGFNQYVAGTRFWDRYGDPIVRAAEVAAPLAAIGLGIKALRKEPPANKIKQASFTKQALSPRMIQKVVGKRILDDSVNRAVGDLARMRSPLGAIDRTVEDIAKRYPRATMVSERYKDILPRGMRGAKDRLHYAVGLGTNPNASRAIMENLNRGTRATRADLDRLETLRSVPKVHAPEPPEPPDPSIKDWASNVVDSLADSVKQSAAPKKSLTKEIADAVTKTRNNAISEARKPYNSKKDLKASNPSHVVDKALDKYRSKETTA